MGKDRILKCVSDLFDYYETCGSKQDWINYLELCAKLDAMDFFDVAKEKVSQSGKRKCRYCECTDNDCLSCIERTGEACYWVKGDVCSACVKELAVDEL